jgi:hypothetical protein
VRRSNRRRVSTNCSLSGQGHGAAWADGVVSGGVGAAVGCFLRREIPGANDSPSAWRDGHVAEPPKSMVPLEPSEPSMSAR